MNIFVYSDESGVFDVEHNEYYVFAGLLFLSKEEMDFQSRKYLAVEKNVRLAERIDNKIEVKATSVSNASKGKLYRSLKKCEKFGIVINQKELRSEIFDSKKHKQRYLDFAYKLSIKRKFEDLIQHGCIDPPKVENIYFFVDEHTTATDGKYELRESMLQEFKLGMFNSDFTCFKSPIFPNLKTLELSYCNSSKKTLVRAADVIANRLYFQARVEDFKSLNNSKFYITRHP